LGEIDHGHEHTLGEDDHLAPPKIVGQRPLGPIEYGTGLGHEPMEKDYTLTNIFHLALDLVVRFAVGTQNPLRRTSLTDRDTPR
jgi:hypothetical protein